MARLLYNKLKLEVTRNKEAAEKCRLLGYYAVWQDPDGVISQKTAFFTVTAAKTSNLT
jgi:hypothetical protein